MRWAVSFYDYHRQNPTPEGWVKRSNPVCSFAHPGEYTEALGLAPETVRQLEAECATLVQPGETYWHHLTTMSETDGLRFMTYMNIFGTRSDLARSAANARFLEQAAPARVTTLWMDEVVADLETSMARLADFLVSGLAAETSGGQRRRLTEALVERLGSALVEAEAADYSRKRAGSLSR